MYPYLTYPWGGGEEVIWNLGLWRKAQQEVRQHWFIDRYIAAYIQVLYRLTEVHLTGLTVDQGCRQVSTGLPPSSGLGWKEKRSEVQPLWRCPLTGQHWFIDSYIAAYIQVLYRVIGVHPTGLTVDEGCRQVSTGWFLKCKY
jgi:hypothetical protein